MSLADVASEVHCDRSAVSCWEHHQKEPTREFRWAYARVLKLTLGELGRIVYEASDPEDRR